MKFLIEPQYTWRAQIKFLCECDKRRGISGEHFSMLHLVNIGLFLENGGNAAALISFLEPLLTKELIRDERCLMPEGLCIIYH